MAEVRGQTGGKLFCPDDLNAFIEKGQDAPFIALLLPWFETGRKTLNIQISAGVTQIFSAGRPPAMAAWAKHFSDKPIYVDIKNVWLRAAHSFSRHISGRDASGIMTIME